MAKRDSYTDPSKSRPAGQQPFPKAGEKPESVKQPVNPTSHGQLRQVQHRANKK